MRKSLIVAMLVFFAMSLVTNAQPMHPMWSFAVNLNYIANDTIIGDSTASLFGMGVSVDEPDPSTHEDLGDTTVWGFYVKVWARKMNNTTNEPESCAVNTNTSYSMVLYSGYHTPEYFTMECPDTATMGMFRNFNLPLENLKEIDGFSPFNFDENDSLYIYIEDRYGEFGGNGPSWVGSLHDSLQWILLDTAWASDPTSGGGSYTWQNNNDTLDPYPLGCWYLTYHPDDTTDTTTHAVHEKPSLPAVPTLGQNSPNPFNSSTDIEFSIPEGANVNLVVTDVLGKHVRTLFDGFEAKGTHTLKWDGLDDEKNLVPSGVYFYKLTVGDNFVDKKKMTLLK